jgi:hypothetical protein
MGLSAFAADSSGEWFPEIRVPDSIRRMSEVRLKVVVGILNAWGAAWISVWPASQFGLAAVPPNVEALKPFCQLANWVLSNYEDRPRMVERGLKAIANWARYLASPHQLWPEPAEEWNTPFFSEGRFKPSLMFCGSIRQKATSLSSLLRLARFARALPPGGEDHCRLAIIEHKANLTTGRIPAPGLAALFKKVVKRVSAGRCTGIEEPGYTLSMSGCYEQTRHYGGAACYLRNEFVTQDQTAWSDATRRRGEPGFPAKFYGHQIQELSGFAVRSARLRSQYYSNGPYEWDMVKHAMHRMLSARWEERYQSPQPNPVRHRVVAVPDRGGFKVRVVTAGEAVVTALSHNVREVFYKTILPFTPSKWAIREKGLHEWVAQMPYLPKLQRAELGDLVLLSCDLKLATDYFPFDLVQAIVDGIECNLAPEQKGSPNWEAFVASTGPQLLQYPRPDRKSPIPSPVITSSGNLMGSAPSWFLLNMFNLGLWRTAWALWADPLVRREFPELLRAKRKSLLDWTSIKERLMVHLTRQFNTSHMPPNYPSIEEITAIVGDDLGAICPFGVCVLYELMLELACGKTSPGKHYVQPAKEGAYLLIAEEAFQLRGGYLYRVNADSLRCVANLPDTYDTRSDVLPWAQLGTTLDVFSSGIPNLARRCALLSYGHMVTSKLRSSLMKMGLPVYLPVWEGGLGWPHPKGIGYALERCSHRQMRVASVLRGFKSDPRKYVSEVAALKSSWKTEAASHAHSKAAKELSLFINSLRVSRDPEGEITVLTDSFPLGFKDPALESRPLLDIIEDLIGPALGPEYLLSPTVGVTEFYDVSVYEMSYTAMSAARKRYDAKCKALLALRSGDFYRDDASISVEVVEADRKFLADFHCLWTVEFRRQFPAWIPQPLSDAVVDRAED